MGDMEALPLLAIPTIPNKVSPNKVSRMGRRWGVTAPIVRWPSVVPMVSLFITPIYLAPFGFEPCWQCCPDGTRAGYIMWVIGSGR
jgi:hypothetical protein